MWDSSHVLEYISMDIKEDISYDEQPDMILDRKEKLFLYKTIPYMKVLWYNHTYEEAIWEGDDDMKAKYPYLVQNQSMYKFRDWIFIRGEDVIPSNTLEG